MTPAQASYARKITGMAAALGADAGRSAPAVVSPARNAVDTAAAQVMLRLTHDLRRLKEIHSIERKIATKRDMLPAYSEWVDGIVAAGGAGASTLSSDVLPTIMVWRIDTGDFAGAMPLIEHVLRYDVALPSRYQRTPAALIVEEVATAALKAQLTDQPFDIAVLEQIEALTVDYDMHDEIRAKLSKAIGFEMVRAIDALPDTDPTRAAAAAAALLPLKRAQQLHERAGAKDKIKRLEKIVAASVT